MTPLYLPGRELNDGWPSPSEEPSAPVALFDSGVGGLTVLEAILRRRPSEATYYIADQAHVPYGGRPLDEIRGFAESLTRHAFMAGAKAVVMACNVSSATYAELGAHRYGTDRVLGVVWPGSKAALEASGAGRIGILATQGTVDSEAYPRALGTLNAGLSVTQVACPRFVPLVEAGLFDSPQAEEAVSEALEPLLRADVDTVVLGCTHYPFLTPVLKRVAPRLTIIDPADATAEALDRYLGPLSQNRPKTESIHRLHTTGDSARFEAQARAFLGSTRNLSFGSLAWQPGLAA